MRRSDGHAPEQLTKAAAVLGHDFKDTHTLSQALTHSEAAGGGANYQRLEFLGDRVLGLVIADELYRRFPNKGEGELALQLNALVRKETCATVLKSLGISDAIRIHKPLMKDPATAERVMGDVCEAIIAAIYLDGGLPPARAFIVRAWDKLFARTAVMERDAKSRLQEWALGRSLPLPVYRILGRTGPDHAPEFHVDVTVSGFDPAEGVARSKRLAEQNAAASFIRREGMDR